MNVHGSPPPLAGSLLRCPGCRAPLPDRSRTCPRCGLLLVGGTAQRLWQIDNEITWLDGRRRVLDRDRATVMEALREESARTASQAPPPAQAQGAREPVPVPAPAQPQGPHTPARHPAAPTGEVTRRSAQNIILGLGGLLVGIAALVFAIWTWSDMSTGSRAGVLGATTAAFAVLARPLHRHGLKATAETFGCLAAVLLCVDALSLWLLSDRFANGPGYTAAALAVIGALMALYPLLVPLRSPRVITALLVQPIPVLLVAALPHGGSWPWILPALAVTALADLLVARRLGRPRPGVPVRTLHVTGTVLWATALCVALVLVLTVPRTDNPGDWWALATALLLSGVTGLLFARHPLPSSPATGGGGSDTPWGAYTVISLLAMGTVPLAAGPPHLPVLPDVPPSLWSGDPSTSATPVLRVLGMAGPMTDPPYGTLYLTAVLVSAALALGAVALLRRDTLVPAAALIAPPTLLAIPLLLDLPHVVATVWALLAGAALVLGTALLPRRRRAWVLPATGTATLLTGVLWSFPDLYTSLAALLLLGATALVALLLSRRTGHGDGPATALYGTGLVLWALALLIGALFLLLLVSGGAAPRPAWWLLAAATLLAGATALLLGRIASPFTSATGAASDPRLVFTLFGLLLLPTVPLLVTPGWNPGLPLFARPAWSESLSVLLEPAHTVLGLSPQGSVPVAAGTVVAGVLVVALTVLVNRRWTPHTVALAMPPALVPVPVVLGATFLSALVWTLMAGSALVLWSALVRDRRVSWLPGLTGLLTLLLGLSWTLPQEHTNVVALMGVAVVGAVVAALARTAVPAVGATAVATALTGAFALALPLALEVPVEYAALAPIAMVAAVAVSAPRLRGPLVPATEIPACLWAVVALVVTVSAGARLELVALELAVVGVIALATAVRPDRRWFALVGGVLMLAALWTVLAAWSVAVPEAYTVPPALAALAIGWEWSRKAAVPPSSWVAYGGGLALLSLPTVGLVLLEGGMAWRVPAVLLLGLVVTVWGLRQRLQAVLVLGGLALVATSLRAFGPPLWDLTRMVPNWVPFATVGVLLLVIGARYEANLERLRRLGQFVSGMR